jgi:Fe-S cluster biogenesis protein NfuA
MDARDAVEQALGTLRPGLAADGYELRLAEIVDDAAHVVLEAGPSACGDCMVPDDMLVTILEQSIGDATTDVRSVRLHKVGFGPTAR